MDYNYHTHTYRCSHATGTPEEYVQSAINAGIKFMGFSDHASFIRSDGGESKYRIPWAESEEYCREIKELSEIYRDKIDIRVGFESEYYVDDFGKMLEHMQKCGAEYLILGQHFIVDEIKGVHVFRETEDMELVKAYADSVIGAIKTGFFSYVAHPDIINYVGDDEEGYRKAMTGICNASKEYNIPVEVNFLGIRESRIYPADRFWKIAGEVGCPVTFGFDAHSKEAAGDIESLKKAKNLAEKFGLNYIGKPHIIDIRKLV